MKKFLWFVLILLIIAGAVGGYFFVKKDNKKTSDSDQAQTTANINTQTKKACEIFTLNDAQQVLGGTVKGGSNDTDNSSSSLMVSTCSYSQELSAGQTIGTSQSATLLVRAPKNGAGITSNQNQFGAGKPADAQQVSGYGDNAYWSPQYGQLNILKHNTWYILTNGPLQAANRTLDQAKKLADVLISKM